MLKAGAQEFPKDKRKAAQPCRQLSEVSAVIEVQSVDLDQV